MSDEPDDGTGNAWLVRSADQNVWHVSPTLDPPQAVCGAASPYAEVILSAQIGSEWRACRACVDVLRAQ